jgi:hypothetical protein
VRSPMAMASPLKPLKSASVTATSATGTCQGRPSGRGGSGRPRCGRRW